MRRIPSLLARINTVLLVLVAILFCIRHMGEPDVWWQIRTGAYILEKGAVPKTDVFSYTYAGTEWINVKWLTEVLMAGLSQLFSPELVLLLQILVSLAVLGVLLASLRQFNTLAKLPPGAGRQAALFCLLLLYCGWAFRLNGRPEMMSHLYTCIFLYLFLRLSAKPSTRLLYLFIPLQLGWTNMHEGYGVGMVLLLLFNTGLFFQHFVFKQHRRYTVKELRTIAVVSLLAVLSTAIHPSGVQMILHPVEIYSQLGSNKFTTELFDFKSKEYWQLAGYLQLAFVASALLGLYRLYKKQRAVFFRLGMGYVLVVLALLYLGFSAYRNIPFALFAAFPLSAHLLAGKSNGKFMTWATAALAIGIYLSVGSGRFYARFLPREKYGLRVDPNRNPIGAAAFLAENNVSGNGFVDYFASSYMLWRIEGFKTYIDLRDLDIFEPRFIENVQLAYVEPGRITGSGLEFFSLLDSLDRFTYVSMVNKVELAPFHRYMMRHKAYCLVYADLNSSVYLKRIPQNQVLIDRYCALSLAEKLHKHQGLPTHKLAMAINRFFWPPYKEVDYQQLNYTKPFQMVRELLGSPQPPPNPFSP